MNRPQPAGFVQYTQPPLLLLCPVLASSLPFIQKRDVDSSPTKWGLHVPPSFSSFTLLHPPPFPGNFSADWVMWRKQPITLETLTSLSWFLPHSQISFWLVPICRDVAISCFSQRIGSQSGCSANQPEDEGAYLGCLEAWSCLPRPFWDSCKGPGSGRAEEGIHFGYKI